MRFHFLDLTFKKFNFYHHCCFKNSVTKPLLYLVNYWSKKYEPLYLRVCTLTLELSPLIEQKEALRDHYEYKTSRRVSRSFCVALPAPKAKAAERYKLGTARLPGFSLLEVWR